MSSFQNNSHNIMWVFSGDFFLVLIIRPLFLIANLHDFINKMSSCSVFSTHQILLTIGIRGSCVESISSFCLENLFFSQKKLVASVNWWYLSSPQSTYYSVMINLLTPNQKSEKFPWKVCRNIFKMKILILFCCLECSYQFGSHYSWR